MNDSDPIQLLRQDRPDVPVVDSALRQRNRDALLDAPVSPKRRITRRRSWVAIGAAAALLLVLVIGILFSPGTSNEDAMAAAVSRLANVAEHQRQIDANGSHQYVVSYFRTRVNWTQALSQERLDELTRNQVQLIDLRNSGGMGDRIYLSRKLTPAERRKQERDAKRIQDRVDARIRAGVKLESLPSSVVVATIAARNVAYRDRHGAGGSGGLRSGRDAGVRYGSAAQSRTAKILQRAQIGGLYANPVMWGGFEEAAGPTFGAPRPEIVKSLSGVPSELLDQLRRLEPDGLAPPGRKLDRRHGDVFSSVAAIVGSPYASPKVRAAAIRLAAELPGVVAAPARDERGHPGLGLTKPIPGGTKRLVFDQSDSRLLGIDVIVDDPDKFGGSHWAGAGKSRIRVLPAFDRGSISTSYDPWIVTLGRPVCHATFCARKIRPVENP
jgi:hypothetical protein